ncbi:MAG: hypothetical protein HC824_05110 [Synechococcales cyanobacterium RM1_1_8]|nr:hypothetical protein [Synechococcales cyanobacterium RM1_1_8]
MILLFLALSLHTAPQLSALAPSLTTSPAPVLSCIFFRVNNPAADLSRYPATLKASSAPEAVIYQQQPGYYALHYPQEPETQPAGALAVFREGEGAIALFQGSPPSRRQTTQPPLPVYGPQGSSDLPLAIPTGEIFVRFRAASQPKTEPPP